MKHRTTRPAFCKIALQNGAILEANDFFAVLEFDCDCGRPGGRTELPKRPDLSGQVWRHGQPSDLFKAIWCFAAP